MENRVRIIGGEWRSRRITFPSRDGLRPTADRVRETLFNWLGQDLHGKSCLDLFAGSGVLGFEAASRGAKEVVMVERDPITFNALMLSAKSLGGPAIQLVKQDALLFLKGDNRTYDVIFLDPPFGEGCLAQVLEHLPPRTHAGSFVYVENSTRFSPPSGWEFFRRDRASKVHYGLLIRSSA